VRARRQVGPAPPAHEAEGRGPDVQRPQRRQAAGDGVKQHALAPYVRAYAAGVHAQHQVLQAGQRRRQRPQHRHVQAERAQRRQRLVAEQQGQRGRRGVRRVMPAVPGAFRGAAVARGDVGVGARRGASLMLRLVLAVADDMEAAQRRQHPGLGQQRRGRRVGAARHPAGQARQVGRGAQVQEERLRGRPLLDRPAVEALRAGGARARDAHARRVQAARRAARARPGARLHAVRHALPDFWRHVRRGACARPALFIETVRCCARAAAATTSPGA